MSTSSLRHRRGGAAGRFSPEGPRLPSRAPAAADTRAAAPAPPAPASDDAVIHAIAAAFSVGFGGALTAPSALARAGAPAAGSGRACSAGGFFLVAAAVAAALVAPGGLPRYFERVAAVAALGFGAMLGGLVGDTVRLF